MATPKVEEGKMLSEALNTVKIQVQQMKRYLVRQRHVQLPNPRGYTPVVIGLTAICVFVCR
jgi:hypothetical protein